MLNSLLNKKNLVRLSTNNNNYKIKNYCSSNNKDEKNHSYSGTLHLPKTKFQMKANAAINEPLLLKDPTELYKWQLENNNNGEWVFHDGPPYANGPLHLGHALNKTLKDIVNRYKVLRGFKVNYIPGWDCHGLPIEQKVFQSFETTQGLKPHTIRDAARKYALKEIERQKKGFLELGIMGDWKNPYRTMDPQYEVQQIQTFYEMYQKGNIYRGEKPVYWSPSSRSALAEAEIEYNDAHVSKSIFVKFNVEKFSDSLKSTVLSDLSSQYFTEENGRKCYALIWTTTPWTIPSNLAISVHPTMEYIIVTNANKKKDHYIISKERFESLKAILNDPELIIVKEFTGEQLKGTVTRHPQKDRISPIICGDHVVEGSGTGLVHTAPGHGFEDFQVWNEYNNNEVSGPILSPVDESGCFTADAGKEFEGLNVLIEGNQAVIKDLQDKNALLFIEEYTHKYPYDWRTKKPILIRVTKQWFASLKSIQEKAVDCISNVNMVPASGANRLSSMVGKRNDWCISRQRVWGCPIPVFYDKNNEPVIDSDTIEHLKELFGKHGSDCWFKLSAQELLPPKYRDQHEQYTIGTDTMDVWFDSGTSWRGVLVERGVIDKDNGKADIYLEGSDQHRGWFQSSLLTSVFVRDTAPYKNVVTHGFLLDEKGFKMSKSLGNVIDQSFVIKGGANKNQDPAYGIDILRTWIASSDYTKDISIGPNILVKILENIKKIRNSFKFMLGSNFDFNPATDSVPYDQMSLIDKYALHKAQALQKSVTNHYDNFQFQKVLSDVLNFTGETSAFYFEIIKQRLYIEKANSQLRKSSQTALFQIVEVINKALAPITIHTSEDIYKNQYHFSKPTDSVFTQGWTVLPQEYQNDNINEQFNHIMTVRTLVNKVLQTMRIDGFIGRSDETQLEIKISKEFYNHLSSVSNELNDIFSVSYVKLLLLEDGFDNKESEVTKTQQDNVNDNQQYSLISLLPKDSQESGKVEIVIKKSDHFKCPRCWRHTSTQKDTLCLPCDKILKN
ncbi:hypothetical protein DICPUDRAFT_75115 [Dictyostelium purpureum]|uniref:isoleucine--tRNA ligase n=1 Tax=Dictyostelium purpureum TaxID=5786 RepID=F0Z9P8_DICPU|nr:uncharacterized protein DICPUDRAFT_75115 [Dictyostelium purpureum]EGC39340.1 hypothetical protein DICPUDRAFT_75115 [Dictyostelium purpureum]|eukprot:XP_003284128.1 hypothetical protein DICPUDRAFT_75115 [Dictyostelium purpureum]